MVNDASRILVCLSLFGHFVRFLWFQKKPVALLGFRTALVAGQERASHWHWALDCFEPSWSDAAQDARSFNTAMRACGSRG